MGFRFRLLEVVFFFILCILYDTRSSLANLTHDYKDDNEYLPMNGISRYGGKLLEGFTDEFLSSRENMKATFQTLPREIRKPLGENLSVSFHRIDKVASF